MKMNSTKFIYNAAHEGATLSIDCRCDVDVEHSAFFRDKELKGNGDFFHVSKGCGSVNHNGCEFHGNMPHNGRDALLAGAGGGFLALIVVLFIVIVLAIRRSRRRAAAGYTETGTSAPLIFSNRPATARSTERDLFNETKTEEGDLAQSDEEAADRDAHPGERHSPQQY